MTASTLGELIARLKRGNMLPRPVDEDWKSMIGRITAEGNVCEIDGETYEYFLEVLPPRWMGTGGFAFGEGSDQLRLLWTMHTQFGRQYFCRQLTEDETTLFCRLARIGRSNG
jgi:Protein of unknown function (DUF1419)